MPAVRIAGAVSLLGLGFLSLAWVLAITQDVHRGGRSPWVLLVCALVVWVAWRQCRAAWMRWHAVMPELTLIWAGPVQAEPPAGGWRLDHPDGVPAEVRCLLDFQGWSRPGRGLGPYVEASVLALLLAGAAVVCQLTGVLWPLYPAVALCGLILWLRRL